MDNKYQDLHIKNCRECEETIFREIQIKNIEFKETEIKIRFIDHNNFNMLLLIDKKDNQIIID